ncbi:MAG: precorrin-6A synthase (deacetylating) [Parvibaculaceae bacterium]
MRKILIIGIGAGNPDHMTVQAIKALNQVDVFFIPNKGNEKAALQKLRMGICERFIEDKDHKFVDMPMPERAKEFTDYRTVVDDWHARISEGYERLIAAELGEDDCGAFLVWGDPALYDSTIRIVERLRDRIEFDYEVIPGISSVQALAAAHRIPLNRIGEPVLITTGRKLADGFPDDAGSVVVMLDGEQTFNRFQDDGLEIFWGAYLGSEEEVLVSGQLSDVSAEIETKRAQAREKNGWIMDTYLLRKSE